MDIIIIVNVILDDIGTAAAASHYVYVFFSYHSVAMHMVPFQLSTLS
jgi:hypothetical protein